MYGKFIAHFARPPPQSVTIIPICGAAKSNETLSDANYKYLLPGPMPLWQKSQRSTLPTSNAITIEATTFKDVAFEAVLQMTLHIEHIVMCSARMTCKASTQAWSKLTCTDCVQNFRWLVQTKVCATLWNSTPIWSDCGCGICEDICKAHRLRSAQTKKSSLPLCWEKVQPGKVGTSSHYNLRAPLGLYMQSECEANAKKETEQSILSIPSILSIQHTMYTKHVPEIS